MFNINYTLSEADGQRPDVGHVLRREPAVRHAELPLQRARRHMSPSDNDRRHRFVGSFHYQPANLWGIGFSGILTLESGLPLTPRITGNLAAATGATNTTGTNGTGGLDRRTVASDSTRIGRLAATRSTCAPRRTSRSAAQATCRSCGRSSTSSTLRTMRQFSDAAYTFIGTPAYDAAANLVTVNLRPDPGYLVRAQRDLELLGHARHAARFEVSLVRVR